MIGYQYSSPSNDHQDEISHGMWDLEMLRHLCLPPVHFGGFPNVPGLISSYIPNILL